MYYILYMYYMCICALLNCISLYIYIYILRITYIGDIADIDGFEEINS